jgi:uncharacterized protein (DUF1697 family)
MPSNKMEELKDALHNLEKHEAALIDLFFNKNIETLSELKAKLDEMRKDWKRISLIFESKVEETSKDDPLEIEDNHTLKVKATHREHQSNVRKVEIPIKLSQLRKIESKSALLLIEKALAGSLPECSIAKSTLLKTITQIYTDIMSTKNWNIDIASYLYYSILKKYGIQAITDKKFLYIISACLKYCSSKRVEVFGRFLGLFEDSYCNEELDVYLAMVKAINSAYFIWRV